MCMLSFSCQTDLYSFQYLFYTIHIQTHIHIHNCKCNIVLCVWYIYTYINVYCVAVIAVPPFPLNYICTYIDIYTDTYARTYVYVHLYAVTGFMFVLPGLTLKIVPLTNSLCYYCHIALLFFCSACCCWCCYYWCFCFFVCFALVVHPPLQKRHFWQCCWRKIHTHSHVDITHMHTHSTSTWVVVVLMRAFVIVLKREA